MAFEIELAVIMIFSVATACLIALFAISRRKKSPWVMFIFVILSLGAFGGLAAFGREAFGPAPDGRVIPIDVVAAPLLIWIVGMILLAKANHDTRMEKQYEITMALNDIAKGYLTSFNIAEASKSSMERVVKSFDADGALLFIMEREKRRFTLLASVGDPPKAFMAYLDRISCSFDKTCAAIDDWYRGNELELTRLRQESDDIFYKEGYRTVLDAQIAVAGRMTGMIIIYARKKLNISQKDKDSLDLVAFELGLWLTQVMNIESMKRLSETQKGMLDITVLLQMELDKDKISHSIINKLIQLVPSRDAMVYLFNPHKKIMWAADAIGKDSEAIMAEDAFPISEAGIAGQILMAGKPEIIPDTLADGRGKQIGGTARETTALLALPLISKGKPLGIIELHRDPPGIFTQEELQIGTLFAQQASIALENAQLLEMMGQEKDRSKLYLDLLSHDIANLNTPLYSYFEMLLKSETSDETKDILMKAHSQIEAMNALVSRVRKLSKGDLEDMEELRTVMVNEILDEAMRGLKRAFPNKEIVVNIEMPEEDPFPARAGEMLDEIFLNILHNAVKFSSGRKVKIDVTIERMEIKGRWFCAVRIADHGSGVPDNMKEDVFSGGKAVAASFARGFGIGLNMCRKLVEKYGGSIWVEDRVRGDHTKGACFVVSLPTMAPKQK